MNSLWNRKKNNISSHGELANISMICTILALSTWNSLSQTEAKCLEQNGVLTQTLIFQPMNFLYAYLLSFILDRSVYNLTSHLLQTLNTAFTANNSKKNLQEDENDLLRQYLRKFTFFYCYYYINTYPNDLSLLSGKRLNMLAIKNLFLIHSI